MRNVFVVSLLIDNSLKETVKGKGRKEWLPIDGWIWLLLDFRGKMIFHKLRLITIYKRFWNNYNKNTTFYQNISCAFYMAEDKRTYTHAPTTLKNIWCTHNLITILQHIPINVLCSINFLGDSFGILGHTGAKGHSHSS